MSQDRDETRSEGERDTAADRADQENASPEGEVASGNPKHPVPDDLPPPPPTPVANAEHTQSPLPDVPPPPPPFDPSAQNASPGSPFNEPAKYPPPPPHPQASAPPLSEEEQEAERAAAAAAAQQPAPPASAPPDEGMPADAPSLNIRPKQEAFNQLPILVANSGSDEAFNGDLVGFISRYANSHNYTYLPPANDRAGHQISIDPQNSMTIHGDQNEFWIEPTGPNAVNESIKFLQECTRSEPDFKVTLSGGSLQERWDIVKKVLDADSPKLEFEAGFNIQQFRDMPGFSDLSQVFRDRQAPAPSAPAPSQSTNQ